MKGKAVLYPSLEEVDSADRISLARWCRFLPSPGQSAIGRSDFNDVLGEEAPIMRRISERFQELGGMTPAISKALGWEGS